jgi:hypothetical protein
MLEVWRGQMKNKFDTLRDQLIKYGHTYQFSITESPKELYKKLNELNPDIVKYKNCRDGQLEPSYDGPLTRDGKSIFLFGKSGNPCAILELIDNKIGRIVGPEIKRIIEFGNNKIINQFDVTNDDNVHLLRFINDCDFKMKEELEDIKGAFKIKDKYFFTDLLPEYKEDMLEEEFLYVCSRALQANDKKVPYVLGCLSKDKNGNLDCSHPKFGLLLKNMKLKDYKDYMSVRNRHHQRAMAIAGVSEKELRKTFGMKIAPPAFLIYSFKQKIRPQKFKEENEHNVYIKNNYLAVSR